MEYPTGQQSTGGGRQNGPSCSSKAGMTQPVLWATSQHLRCHGDRGGTGGKASNFFHKCLWAKLFLASPFYNPCLRALCHQKLDICPNCRAENLVPVLSVGLPQSPWPHFCSATCRPQLTQRREIQWSRLKLNGKELGPCYYLSRSPSRISIFIQPRIPVNLFLPPQSNKSD